MKAGWVVCVNMGWGGFLPKLFWIGDNIQLESGVECQSTHVNLDTI